MLKRFLQAGRPRDRADCVHFLHIGKTAGTTIKTLLAEVGEPQFRLHKHYVRLRDIPPEARYFFSIRDPLTRFYSGFYSRKRQGRPRYDRPWSESEKIAFGEFEHANDLAEALFGDRSDIAVAAMLSIQHVSQNQVSWFAGYGNALIVRPPLCIIRQEKFAEDVAAMCRVFGMDPAVFPLEKPMHSNDYDGKPPLSEPGIANLRKWYLQDLHFYALCEAWIASHQSA